MANADERTQNRQSVAAVIPDGAPAVEAAARAVVRTTADESIRLSERGADYLTPARGAPRCW